MTGTTPKKTVPLVSITTELEGESNIVVGAGDADTGMRVNGADVTVGSADGVCCVGKTACGVNLGAAIVFHVYQILSTPLRKTTCNSFPSTIATLGLPVCLLAK